MGQALTDRVVQIATADALLTQALAILDAIDEPQAAAHINLGLQTLRGSRIRSSKLLPQDCQPTHEGTSYHWPLQT